MNYNSNLPKPLLDNVVKNSSYTLEFISLTQAIIDIDKDNYSKNENIIFINSILVAKLKFLNTINSNNLLFGK